MLNYPAIELVSGLYRKSPSGRTLWCGPFALAVITGLPYDDAYAKAFAVEKRVAREANRAYNAKRGIKSARGPYKVPKSTQGLSKGNFKEAARLLGVKVQWAHLYGKGQMTLLTFTRDHTVKDHVYVVVAGNHYEVICNGVLYHSHHDPVKIEDAPKYRMAKVTAWADVKVRPAALASAESTFRPAVPSPRKDDRRTLFTPAPVPVAVQPSRNPPPEAGHVWGIPEGATV